MPGWALPHNPFWDAANKLGFVQHLAHEVPNFDWFLGATIINRLDDKYCLVKSEYGCWSDLGVSCSWLLVDHGR